jgi:hypothetical protein
MWGPVYLRIPIGSLYLFPLFILMLVPIMILAVRALWFGLLSLRGYGTHPPGSVIVSVVVASAMVIVPLPALWFGNAPLLLFG